MVRNGHLAYKNTYSGYPQEFYSETGGGGDAVVNPGLSEKLVIKMQLL